MKEYTYTKIFGVISGALAIIGGIAFGTLAFIGMGLSNAWNTETNSSTERLIAFAIPSILLLFGLITSIGSFRLKSKGWKIFYVGFCLLLGIGFVMTFFISLGSIGYKIELLILCIGVNYLWLSYLAKKKK